VHDIGIHGTSLTTRVEDVLNASGYGLRVMTDEHSADHDLIRRLRDARDRHKDRRLPIRVAVVLAGFTVLLGGLAMLVLPGPAFAVIPLGLFLLALEFAWAERALEHAVTQAEAAKQKAADTSRAQRLAAAVAIALAVAGAVAAALVWDIPLLPV
jgi:uncharacterized protein (TIGR02611 family)